jgi:hypothetical protein
VRADAAALQGALSSAARALVSAALAAAGGAVSGGGSGSGGGGGGAARKNAAAPTHGAGAAAAPLPADAPDAPSPWRFPAFMRPRGGAGAPLLGGGAGSAAAPGTPPPHPGGSRLARARAAASRAAAAALPASVERSVLAYAALLLVFGGSGLACVPSFPLLWRCGGILPLFSLFLIALLFGAAYVVALLPEPSNLLPAAGLTALMATFYLLRLSAADKLRIRGPRSAADAVFLTLSLVELLALALGARRRRQQRLGRSIV